MNDTHKISFNHGRQSLVFVIRGSYEWFRKHYDCDAYYTPKNGREKRVGVFGYIHIPKTGIPDSYNRELVAHEVSHAVMFDWLLCKATSLEYIRKREEQVATLTGEIARKLGNKLRR